MDDWMDGWMVGRVDRLMHDMDGLMDEWNDG
jgi:hypothetical protein